MTRQVIPSMLLSVLIVCFFSVVLYEHEKPRPTEKSAIPKTDGGSSPPASDTPTSSGPATEASPKPARPAGSPAAAEPTPPAPASPGEPVREKGSSNVEPSPRPAPGPEPKLETKPETNSEAPRPAASPATPPESTGALEKPSGPPSGPSSPFTTVKQGESLEDVSVRVYGSTDQVQAIWRANRDLLPKRDSPLPAGSVLRTPAE